MQLGHEATIKRLESVSQHERNKSITVEEVYENVIKVKFNRDN